MGNHTLKVTRTARYSTQGQITQQTRYCILACHGYGQLAEHFIKKFDILAGDDLFVIAPEGLSRFYWGGLTGDVVASWMTKGGRLEEIQDYCGFLDQLKAQYLDQLPENCEIILFGFSQGCATIMRWVMQRFPKCTHLAFWAGMIPEDLDYKPHLTYFEDKAIHFFHGDQDPLITPDRLQFIRKVIRETGLNRVQEIPFVGKHTVVRSALKDWFDSTVRA